MTDLSSIFSFFVQNHLILIVLSAAIFYGLGAVIYKFIVKGV